MEVFNNMPDFAQEVISSAFTTAFGLLLFYIIFYFLKRWAHKKKYYIPELIDSHLHLPGVLFFVIISLNIDIKNFQLYLSKAVYQNLRHALFILFIIASCFLIIRIISLIKEIIVTHVERQHRKDYRLRIVRTKYLLIQRVINILIITTSLAVILMTFSPIRQLGSAILASAGIAGIVIGFAAQKSLGSILAGIQIAIAQPIKIDDTVVVDNTFGTVGEITLTYVVVNTWDGKRLIVPITYFLEKTFVNWTRVSAEVVGIVKIHTDYSLPIEDVRKEFESWLDNSPLWDKRSRGLLITGANDTTMEVRATMSAKDSGDAFDLECVIREKLITYIREKHPQALPGIRIKSISTDNEQNKKGM